jgi:hypothetical protein
LRFWIAEYAQSVGCTSEKDAGAANTGAAVNTTAPARNERITIKFLM